MENLRNDRKVLSENSKSAIVLFFIHPLSALIISFRHYRAGFSKDILWLFVMFFGFTFAISNQDMDANRQREYLENFARSEISVSAFTELIYAETNGYLDVLQPLIMFLVSRLTENYRVLFAIYGIIFGFFYSRNIWYLIEKSGPAIKRIGLPFIITFALIVGFWQINGFRMWTAAHLFFFGAIQFLIEKKRKGILIATTSVFIHFSYLLPVVALFLFSLLKNRVNFYYWFFILTFFLAQIDLEIVRETLLDWLPSAFHSKVTSYTHEASVEKTQMGFEIMNWYAVFYNYGLRWVIFVLISVFHFFIRKNTKTSKNLQPLLGFSLFLYGVINLIGHVPSLSRFYSVANLFSIAYIFLFLQQLPKLGRTKIPVLISIPAVLLFSIVAIRASFDMVSILTILGNPVLSLFFTPDVSIIQIIK